MKLLAVVLFCTVMGGGPEPRQVQCHEPGHMGSDALREMQRTAPHQGSDALRERQLIPRTGKVAEG